MKASAIYAKIVEWSAEDNCYVGSAPGLILGGCHGTDEQAVFEELCQIVDEAVALAVPEAAARRLTEQLGVDPRLGERLSGLADDAQSALNALVGDFLAARGNGLAIDMSLVHAGKHSCRISFTPSSRMLRHPQALPAWRDRPR